MAECGYLLRSVHKSAWLPVAPGKQNTRRYARVPYDGISSILMTLREVGGCIAVLRYIWSLASSEVGNGLVLPEEERAEKDQREKECTARQLLQF